MTKKVVERAKRACFSFIKPQNAAPKFGRLGKYAYLCSTKGNDFLPLK
jgi:hypothetical protein